MWLLRGMRVKPLKPQFRHNLCVLLISDLRHLLCPFITFQLSPDNNEVELAERDTPRMTTTAGEWTENARPHINALIEQGLNASMVQELIKEMGNEVE